ncbi:hypothetical protein SAMN05444162_3127 [Paenibacillaceae bacterium GAS479]|nr:hypothetical protein SAMN05444162_3127 [Paenibacillaceae bacterium GAS479]
MKKVNVKVLLFNIAVVASAAIALTSGLRVY